MHSTKYEPSYVRALGRVFLIVASIGVLISVISNSLVSPAVTGKYVLESGINGDISWSIITMVFITGVLIANIFVNKRIKNGR